MPNKISTLIILATACVALTFGVAACNKTNIQEEWRPEPTGADRQSGSRGRNPAAAAAIDQQQPATQTTQQNYQQPAQVQQTASRPSRAAGLTEPDLFRYPARCQLPGCELWSASASGTTAPATAAAVFAATVPREWLFMDARILELRSSGLLLGSWRLGLATSRLASCGPPDIGDSWQGCIATTTDPGANMSATTAVLTTDTGTSAPATRVVTGAEIVSTITVPSTT